MQFNSNNDLMPGKGFSKTKEKELENKVAALQQLVTSLSDKITQLESEIVTETVTADSVTAQNVNADSVTVDSAEVTTETVGTSNIANLNASDIEASTVEADSAVITEIEAESVRSNSVNSNSYTGVSQHLTGNSKVDGITDLNEVNANSVTTTELESENTSLTGSTVVRGNVQFPEDGDKIYGEYLEVDADVVKVKSLTTETPQDSSKLVGYDENGALIPIDGTLDPTNLWQFNSEDKTYIEPKNDKKLSGDVINVEYEDKIDTLQNTLPKLGKVKTVNSFDPDDSGNILVSWYGTRDEYEEVKDTIPDGVIIHITDDVDKFGNIINDNEIKLSKTWSSRHINNLFIDMTGIRMQKVTALPTEDISVNTIYLLTTEYENVYTKYIYDSATSQWVTLGNTEIVLEGYVKQAYLTQAEYEALEVKDPDVDYNIFEEK